MTANTKWKTVFEPKYEPYSTCIPTEIHDLAYREYRRHESFLGRLIVKLIGYVQGKIETSILKDPVVNIPFIDAQLTYSIRCRKPVRLTAPVHGKHIPLPSATVKPCSKSPEKVAQLG